jgi:hypothetical protein
MTPEELEEMEKNTPEWKRGALVVTDAAAEEEKPGMFGRFSKKVKTKISSTDAAKKFAESEEYAKLNEFR